MIRPSGYDIDDIQDFFEHDTYRDLLDLLVALVSGHYRLDILREDIDEYLASRPLDIEKLEDIDYE